MTGEIQYKSEVLLKGLDVFTVNKKITRLNICSKNLIFVYDNTNSMH